MFVGDDLGIFKKHGIDVKLAFSAAINWRGDVGGARLTNLDFD
jgi:hypothetical protein